MSMPPSSNPFSIYVNRNSGQRQDQLNASNSIEHLRRSPRCKPVIQNVYTDMSAHSNDIQGTRLTSEAKENKILNTHRDDKDFDADIAETINNVRAR